MYQTCNTCTEDNDSEGLHISNESSAVSCDYSGFDIVKATQYGALERVKELVEAGHDVNQPDSETVYLLHWAAINNRLDIIKFLLERGAHVDAVGGELQASSLHWATRQGHLQAVVLLVKAGADPGLKDAEGLSCLHIAAQFGHTAIVAYFIAKGLSPDLLDRGGMTPIMWAAWKVQALDPVRVLLTLGANATYMDHTHGNTALHWAILSRNPVVISTLISKGKISLDIPNMRGDTPLKMLQQHIGAGWLGDKLNSKIKELTRSSSTSPTKKMRGRRLLTKFTSDKRLRFWTMVSMPFLFFYITGQILSIETYFIIRMFLIGCLYAIASTIGRWMFDDKLLQLLPLSIYLATKIWFYITWLLYIAPVAPIISTLLFFVSSLGLWYFFLHCWKGDPGIVKASMEERFYTIIELSEKGGVGFEPSSFCSACLVSRPVRSKHCSVCDKCVAKLDHHCPWIGNCVGYQNHKYFIGFLFNLIIMCVWMCYGGVTFYREVCDIEYADGLASAMFVVGNCQPWMAWTMANAFLHFIWVTILLICQLYQILWLAMTTNERMNRDRYRHFIARGGKSPFDQGFFQNFADFFGCKLFGLVKPQSKDWLRFYWHEFDFGEKLEAEPLLGASDNYQFV